jgi:hypothetical protein
VRGRLVVFLAVSQQIKLFRAFSMRSVNTPALRRNGLLTSLLPPIAER